MVIIIGSILGAYLVFVVGMFALQRIMIYHPSSTPPASVTKSGVPEMQEVHAKTNDGLELLGWFAPPKKDKPLLILFHGNAGSIADRAHKARRYLDWGYGVLLAEYRGFGGNPGSPSEDGLFADARAWLAVAQDNGFGPDKVVLYGESLGTGPAVRMASEMAENKTPVAAVVLEAPYTTLVDVAQHHYPYTPAKWLIRDAYDSLSRIGRIYAPLIVIHGTKDPTIPIKFGKVLFAAAAEPKLAHWVKEAGHNNLYDFAAAEVIDNFLAREVPVR
jgi:fermentation-respiration switch protein FrsA (DUF1100 family)